MKSKRLIFVISTVFYIGISYFVFQLKPQNKWLQFLALAVITLTYVFSMRKYVTTKDRNPSWLLLGGLVLFLIIAPILLMFFLSR